jgi:hypothetical protein
LKALEEYIFTDKFACCCGSTICLCHFNSPKI